MTNFHFFFLGGLIVLAALAMLGNAVAWKMEQRAATRAPRAASSAPRSERDRGAGARLRTEPSGG